MARPFGDCRLVDCALLRLLCLALAQGRRLIEARPSETGILLLALLSQDSHVFFIDLNGETDRGGKTPPKRAGKAYPDTQTIKVVLHRNLH